MSSALDVLTNALSRASLSETPRDTAARLVAELDAAGFSIVKKLRSSLEKRDDETLR